MQNLQEAVLATYTSYLSQLGKTQEAQAASQALTQNPDLAKAIFRIFDSSFNPAHNSSTQHRTQTAQAQAHEIIASLPSLQDATQQEALKKLITCLLATVRTNAYQNKQTIAIKLATRRIPFAPLPKPLFEIFVSGPDLEGIHLRFGKVARGGLRWSDRPQDFRTEVLGLVKAQVTKNTVIIPTGSKGGFVPKNLPDRDQEPERYQQMGLAAYKLFISSLLDVTDNLIHQPDGSHQITTPQNLVALDEPDHYLVVAADKGTATFSDTANAISADYGFWLGDAFASGGSIGFDHKEMSITARGAWESVKHHLGALGQDSQKQDFTMIGIGGMAGDVFGNGALLSPHIRLLGAFDSRHIFVDPNPDAASSLAERQRLFNLPRAYWTDYNPQLISEGGGVYSRKDPAIPLTEPLRQALDLDYAGETISGDQLIRALLKAPADLLYTGGTGTYVRASDEDNKQVGDPSNDHLRITAPELRVRFISEGGNLGLTQRARIQAAQQGILVNTDAVDNSAGVETSDREVNLKILLQSALQAGELTEEGRETFIQEQIEEVGQRVLASNREQNILLWAERVGAFETNQVADGFMTYLEEAAGLDRAVEFLPDSQQLARRAEGGQGLTSPELSVLMAYAKIAATSALLKDGYADQPDLNLTDILEDYFPGTATERFGHHFDRHPLRKEIIATRAANRVINHTGITFFYQMQEEFGASAGQVARAFRQARQQMGSLPHIPYTGDIQDWAKQANNLRQTTVRILQEMVA